MIFALPVIASRKAKQSRNGNIKEEIKTRLHFWIASDEPCQSFEPWQGLLFRPAGALVGR
jgi:hypothetical protein